MKAIRVEYEQVAREKKGIAEELERQRHFLNAYAALQSLYTTHNSPGNRE